MSDTSSNQGTAQGFPNNISAFVNPETGQLTPMAYRFLLAMWTRTGGGGGSNANVTSGLLTMTDVEDAPTMNTGTMLLMDDVTPGSIPQSLLLMAEGADTVTPTPNPVMAAEMATMQDAPTNYPGLWAMVITDEP